MNIVPVIIGSVLVTYVEPVASGSGIPLVKCYLNGIKVPKVVRLRTLTVKAVGVITSVVGGLAGGKEGPMVHCGAVIAAGISQGKSSSFDKDFKMLRYFRDDHEKRDFVVCGSAAGVAAAFGAPIGGLLFALEEAASFWNQALIWRTLFASIISSFTLNLILSKYHGIDSQSYHGLFNLGEFEPFPFMYYELPIFMLMGSIGGLSGAFWIKINSSLNIFRDSFIKQKWIRIIEAVLVAALSASFACLMMYLLNDCRPLGENKFYLIKFILQFYLIAQQATIRHKILFNCSAMTMNTMLQHRCGFKLRSQVSNLSSMIHPVATKSVPCWFLFRFISLYRILPTDST
jgi:chloride channel 7